MYVAYDVLLSCRKLKQGDITELYICVHIGIVLQLPHRPSCTVLDFLYTSVSLVLYLNLCGFFNLTPCHLSDNMAL
jgi:hypothetical protein